jgi:Flp pilus assembly protein TadD
MKRLFVAVAVVCALGLSLAYPRLVAAQLTTAGIRGRVVDEAGNGIAGVKIDMEFKGESRKKIAHSQETDKRGGFVRMGLLDGKWQLTFTKEGYATYAMEIGLSLGGFAESGDVVLKPAAAKAADAAAPGAELSAGGAPPPGTSAAEASGFEHGYAAALEAAKAGRYDEAEAGLKELLAKAPEAANAHYNLGYVYRMKKDWKAAEAEYVRVIELEPTKLDAHFALAAVRDADGRSDKAAEGMLAAAPGFASDARFQYVLGVTCVNAGRGAEAMAALRKVLELDPANAEAHYQLATVLVGQGKTADAVQLLEKYVGMTGQDAANLQTAKSLLAALKK